MKSRTTLPGCFGLNFENLSVLGLFILLSLSFFCFLCFFTQVLCLKLIILILVAFFRKQANFNVICSSSWLINHTNLSASIDALKFGFILLTSWKRLFRKFEKFGTYHQKVKLMFD